MKIVLEFYRIRKVDDAHAVVGRETANAADLDDAIGLAAAMANATCRSGPTPCLSAITKATGSTRARSTPPRTLDERTRT